MSDPKGQHEPSMEEILASIRRIIAEDGEPAAAPATEEKAQPQRGEEVLELTEVVEEDGTVVSITAGGKRPAPEPPPPAKPIFGVETPPPQEEPEPPPPPFVAPPLDEDDRLVSAATESASVSALSQLSALGAGRDQLGNLPLGDAGRTLEDLVRELLKPMLRDWLDANLPQLVERLVQDEIRRMSREAQSR
jgi:uncharacterized protein